MTRRPFPLAVPTELRPYILDFHWALELLHALDLPAVSLQVADLADHLDLPFWAYDGRPFQLTPHQVAAITGHKDLREIELYAAEFNREVAARQAMASLEKRTASK